MKVEAGKLAPIYGFIFLLFLPRTGNTKEQAAIIVHIDHIRSAQGVLRVSLFESSQGFPSNPTGAAQRAVVEITGSSQTVTFTSVGADSCAISVLHDLNQNGHLDKSIVGIPVEPIAVSNNVPIRFGPPSFEAAVFPVQKPHTSLTIHLP